MVADRLRIRSAAGTRVGYGFTRNWLRTGCGFLVTSRVPSKHKQWRGRGYWLYAAYECATPNPRLVRVQDPFGNLLAKAKGSVLIGAQAVLAAATPSP